MESLRFGGKSMCLLVDQQAVMEVAAGMSS
jgi:hypothetical protein